MSWDQVAVFLIVLAAVAYLFRRWQLGRSGACGGCNSDCGTPKQATKNPSATPALVQLEVLPRPSKGGSTSASRETGHLRH